ncbi:phosphotransferase enzyme family protein [Phytomonospora endophytica]|uniref:Spectinomycin phosphotransferase n=1 Tax=Phytomonospora endophytica TaxID=714109 RepID=A0A841FKX2_9ACTN|nr:phosphotransferase [Phytomonospora endophytica]MBB6033289.1 spectinomycin phosphotransferase [Phytomonospora endophytica]
MQERPKGLDEADLAAVLGEHWAARDDLTYAPVGFGGYHWTTARHFVTVTDLEHTDTATLTAAMDTALALAGLDFVVAPLPAKDGRSVVPLGERWAVTLFPLVAGEPGSFFDVPSPRQRADMAAVLARLHRAAPPAPPRHDPALAARVHLDEALTALETPWGSGPYGDRTRKLLRERESGVRAALARFDTVAARIAAMSDAELVVTHGEPHRGNVLADGERLLLIDWDTVRLAPPERDLWMGLGDDGPARELYARVTGHEVSAELMAFYELRWALDDVSIYVRDFRAGHGESADSGQAWTGLDGSVRWLARDES